jgi:hypothetical protein
MNDDWRLRVDLHEEGRARELADALEQHEGGAGGALGHLDDQVIISHDGPEVFCYSGTRAQAEGSRTAVEGILKQKSWQADLELLHWHPSAERWEDPDKPLPTTDAELAEERRERVEQERADSATEGYPEFEVRIKCKSRHDAGELARKLHDEGIPYVHRWSAVMVGATDEDSANALADRLRAEAPEGSTVSVEGNLRAVYDDRPGSRFRILGGLGG